MILYLRKKLFLNLSFGFLLCVVAGTLSHELGHYTAARLLGYQADINYRSTTTGAQEEWLQVYEVQDRYLREIKQNLPFPGREAHFKKTERLKKHSTIISAAGPVTTLLIGGTGLALLFYRRNELINSPVLTAGQWALIFLAFFWLRQPFNLVMHLAGYLLGGGILNDDESAIALAYGLPGYSISTAIAVPVIIVLTMVFFRFVPKTARFSFLCAGLAGGLSGFYLWFYHVGPVVMP